MKPLLPSNKKRITPLHGLISQSTNQSVLVHQSASQSAKQLPTTTIIQSNAPRNAASLYVSLTPTRTVWRFAGNPFNLTQLILSLCIHSLTQHATCTPFSGFLSFMPLSLTWLHPLMLLSHSVRCALQSRATSRLLPHAAPYLARPTLTRWTPISC